MIALVQSTNAYTSTKGTLSQIYSSINLNNRKLISRHYVWTTHQFHFGFVYYNNNPSHINQTEFWLYSTVRVLNIDYTVNARVLKAYYNSHLHFN